MLSFIMTPGMNLTAYFLQNPFAATQGTYSGLINSPVPLHDRVGLFRLVATRTGGFSGKFFMGGVTYLLRGRFRGNGTFSAIYSSRNLSIQMKLDLDNGTDQITGSLSDGTFISTLVANRTEYNLKTNPAPQSGPYTILIPPNRSRPSSPQGNGVALLKVDASGNARVSGSLADGTPFSQSAPVSKNSA